MQIEAIDSLKTQNPECARWSAIYAGQNYYYGFDAGSVARRTMRYGPPLRVDQGMSTALDVGCGEGQDVAFLSERSFLVTGLDFVPNAIEKAARLLEARELKAELHAGDLREWHWGKEFDLVLAVNSLQFLGDDAPGILTRVIQSVAVNGVLGLSLFACEAGSEVRGSVFFIALEELMNYFDCQGHERSWQMLETADLWQWNASENAPQHFVTLIAQRLK